MTTSAATATASFSISPCSSSSCFSSLNRIHQRVPITTRTTRFSIPRPIGNSSIHLFTLSSIRGAQRRRQRFVSCDVALKFDASSSVDASVELSESEEDEEDRLCQSKIGARVRVKGPQLKVYHVPKVPEMDIAGMEGEIKQYVAVWKGKRISANFPFKVEFFTEIEGRGRVKFFAHLREDEFDYLSQQQ